MLRLIWNVSLGQPFIFYERRVIMARIKTRDVVTGTIKTIDKATVQAERLKHSYAKTKSRVETAAEPEEGSPAEYASTRVDQSLEQGVNTAITGKSHYERSNHYKRRRNPKSATKNQEIFQKNFYEQKSNSDVSASRGGKGIKQSYSGKRYKTAAANRAQATHVVRTRALANERKRYAIRQITNAKVTSKRRLDMICRIIIAIAHGFKVAITSTKALISAIIAGGWISMIVIVVCCIFGAAFHFFGDTSNNYLPVSEEVEKYTPVIREYAEKYDMEEYVELIKAVMMQESGGKGTDPMQSSESGYNKKYDRKPSAIKDPNYSIECGIQALKSCLDKAGVQDPLDMERIKLALQGYNFGSGYIDWALKKYGGYSPANAVEFSKEKAAAAGKDTYGDPDYVSHVLRYYPYGNYSYDIIYNGPGKLGLPIEGMTQANISSHFGGRASPGGIGSTNHQGVDIAFPTGTKILACESGKVIHAGWAGGLGKCVIIDHGKGVQTVYGHMSEVVAVKGQMAMRGQVIGQVGSTGNSTGPHLHLGVKVNGSYVNPEKGWLSIPK